QEDDVVRSRLRLGPTQTPLADRVQPRLAAVGIAAAGDQARHRRRSRRQTPYVTSAPTTVATSCTAFPPRSFDSPLARSRMSTGTSTTVSPASSRRSNDSTSGAPLSYGSARIGIARELTAYMPLVASRKGRPRAARIPRRSTAVPNRRLGLG